jgi:hypothetical protein
MKRFLLAALAAGLVAQPADLSAQLFYNGIPDAQEYLDFVSGSGVNGGYGVQVGPYVGRFTGDPGMPQFSIYCVDYTHFAKDQTVNTSALAGSLSNTRLNSYAQYQKAAYLASLFDTAPTSAWGSIHAAIWSVTSGVSVGSSTGRSYYLGLANSNAAGFNTDGWYVLTPTNPTSSSSGQEFLMRSRTVSVPEPAAFLLIATGMLLLAGASRRRLTAFGADV